MVAIQKLINCYAKKELLFNVWNSLLRKHELYTAVCVYRKNMGQLHLVWKNPNWLFTCVHGAKEECFVA